MRRAVILAGGKGLRLRPYTTVIPKPLMPIGEYPILEIIIRQLAAQNFRHITLAVNHQAEVIQAFFGNGQKWDVHIDYSIEDKPLSTMGPLRLIENLPEDFLVMNGDILTDLDYTNFFASHVNNQNLFTISSYRREHTIDYGVLDSDDNLRLKGFSEKPRTAYNVSMGIYMLNRAILEYIPKAREFGFDELMLKLLHANIPVHINPYHGYWLDIGRPDDYMIAIEEFDKKRALFLGA